MEFTILLLLISIGGCLSMDYECLQKEKSRNCEGIDVPSDFPQTEEELKAVCRTVLTLGDCSTAAQEKCKFPEEIQERHRKLIEYVRRVCEEDNPIFQVISNNLNCIAVASGQVDDICRRPEHRSEENENILSKHLQELEEDHESLRCLDMLLEAACPAVTAGFMCESNDVKEAAMQLLGKFFNHRVDCSDEILDKLEPIYNVYETILLEELQLMKDAIENE